MNIIANVAYMEKKKMNVKTSLKQAKRLQRFASARSETRAKHRKKTNTNNNRKYYKKEYLVFRYGLCKYKMRICKNNNNYAVYLLRKGSGQYENTESFFAKKYQR